MKLKNELISQKEEPEEHAEEFEETREVNHDLKTQLEEAKRIEEILKIQLEAKGGDYPKARNGVSWSQE